MRACVAVVLLVSAHSLAQALPDAAQLRKTIAPHLAKPLPTTASIVGIAMPAPSPMVAVASFGDRSQPADGDRGYATGRTLNELLFGAHEALDVERPEYYSLDSGMPGIVVGRNRDSKGNAYRVAQREGAQWCVWGNVDGDAKAYRVALVIDRCSEGSQATVRTFVVAAGDAWPRALRDMCEHVVAVAAGALSPRAQKACARGEAVRAQSFLAFAQYAAASGMPRERVEAIVAEDPRFVPAVMDLIDRLPEGSDRAAFYRRLNAMVADAGATPAVKLAAYWRMLPHNWHISQRPFSDLYVLIRADPQLRAGWLSLAAGLAQTVTWGFPQGNAAVEWMKDKLRVEGAKYSPNDATHQASLALALDYYANWPQSYRARWQMGYALMQYAWMVRGNETWPKVPHAGKRAWLPLNRLADQFTAAALEQQPGAPTLWANRINTTYHIGGDWLLVFDKAAERHPHASQVYEAAMRYAQPKWGGDDLDRSHIRNLAVRNNPDAEWAKTLIERYEPTGTIN